MSKLFIYLKYNWLQIILIILSIYDLRIDLRILLDYFTFSTLFYTIFEHPLAITILITSPYLFNSINKTKSNIQIQTIDESIPFLSSTLASDLQKPTLIICPSACLLYTSDAADE